MAFQEEIGLPQEQLAKLSIGLGGGIGRLRLTCGAVSGMAIVLSYLLSDGEDKLAIYSVIQKACGEFKNELGSLTCAELLEGITYDNSPKPEERTQNYYAKRPCAEIVRIAGDITQKYLEQK